MGTTTARRAESILVFVVAIWGGTFILTKGALGSVPPLLLTSLRFLCAFAIAAVMFRKALSTISASEIRYGLGMGLLFTTGFALQTAGLSLTTVTRVGFLTGTTVLFTPFVWKFFRKKDIGLKQWLSVVLVLAGLVLFMNPMTVIGEYTSGPRSYLGDLLVLGSALIWALYMTALEHVHAVMGPENLRSKTYRLVVMQFFSTALLCGVLSFLFESAPAASALLSVSVLSAIAYNSIFASVVANTLQMAVQTSTTAIRASLIFSLEPLIAAVLAFFFLGERMNTWELWGGAAMVLGVLAPVLIDLRHSIAGRR